MNKSRGRENVRGADKVKGHRWLVPCLFYHSLKCMHYICPTDVVIVAQPGTAIDIIAILKYG